MVVKAKTTNTKKKSKWIWDVSLFKKHDNDTWSPSVQIWILSKEIKLLQEHMVAHPKDYDAKRSLLKKVSKRRRLLKYLKLKDIDVYLDISKKVWVKV